MIIMIVLTILGLGSLIGLVAGIFLISYGIKSQRQSREYSSLKNPNSAGNGMGALGQVAGYCTVGLSIVTLFVVMVVGFVSFGISMYTNPTAVKKPSWPSQTSRSRGDRPTGFSSGPQNFGSPFRNSFGNRTRPTKGTSTEYQLLGNYLRVKKYKDGKVVLDKRFRKGTSDYAKYIKEHDKIINQVNQSKLKRRSSNKNPSSSAAKSKKKNSTKSKTSAERLKEQHDAFRERLKKHREEMKKEFEEAKKKFDNADDEFILD